MFLGTIYWANLKDTYNLLWGMKYGNPQIFEFGRAQCWAKFITPTGNFPAAYDPNRKLKNLTGHFPTSDNINRHMLKKKSTYQIFYFYFSITCRDFQCG